MSSVADHVITGRAGTVYFIPTVKAVDKCLRSVRAKLSIARPPAQVALLADCDTLLDARNRLVFAEHTRQALALTK